MQPGEQVGPYVLERELGRGAMGVVYAARHPANDQPVALKLIADPLVGQRLLLRFEREGRALAALQHPNIVRVHSSGEHRGRPYLALEFVDGVALDAELKRKGPWEPRRAAALVATLAQALAHAHAQGILHRDLKPANVLLDTEGQPRLTDFGLAREPGADREHLTRTGEVLGTPSFMSPEQANGQAQVDQRADVYGLGAVLFALLTGRPPFRGSSSLAVLQAVLETPPPRPSSLRPGIPRQLEAVCLRCLAKDPARRFANASALARELERVASGEDAPRSRRALLALTAGLLILASVVLVATLLERSEKPQPPPGEVQHAPAPTAEPSDAQRFAQARAASRELCALSLEDELEAVLTRGAELEEAGLLTGRGYLHLARASAKRGELAAACARYAEAGARWADLPDSELDRLDLERRDALLRYGHAPPKRQKLELAVTLSERWVAEERRPAARRHALWVASLQHRLLDNVERAIELAVEFRDTFPGLLGGYDLHAHALFRRWRLSPPETRTTADLEHGVAEITRAIQIGASENRRKSIGLTYRRGKAYLDLYRATADPAWLELALADGERVRKRPRDVALGRSALLCAVALRKLGRLAEARTLLVETIPKVKERRAQDLLRAELTLVVQEDF